MSDDPKYSDAHIAELAKHYNDRAAAQRPKFNRIAIKEPYGEAIQHAPKNALIVKTPPSDEAIAELRKSGGVIAMTPSYEGFAETHAGDAIAYRQGPCGASGSTPAKAEALNPYVEMRRRFGYILTYLRAKWPEFAWTLDPLDFKSGKTARVTLSVALSFSGDAKLPRACLSFDVGPEYCLNDGQSEAGECEKACLDMDVANMLREAFADDAMARTLRRRIRTHREGLYADAAARGPRLSVGFAPLKDGPGTIHVDMDGTGIAPATDGERFARAFGQKPPITAEVDVYFARTGRPRLMP